MAEAQAKQYHTLLEIISRVNQVADQNRGIEETLSRIIETLQVLEEQPNPVSTRIIFDRKEYRTRGFKETANCRERSFKTFSGKIGHFQTCQKKKEAVDTEDNKTEQFYFTNNMVSILLRFLNQTEDELKFRDRNRVEDTNVMYGAITSEFLQRFLNKRTYNRDIFHDLMPFKVKEILLISSLYDAYAIEREGRFSEHMLGVYGQLNLTSLPRITGVSSLSQAFNYLKRKHFDLIIYMVGVDKRKPIVVSEKIKEVYPYIPIYLLLNNNTDVGYYLKMQGQLPFIDQLFAWNGDVNIFFTMIKYLEDEVNVENDTQLGEVRVILVIEDNPVYYSRYLSFLYRVVMDQTRRIIEDVAVDELYKVLRLRARPKILMVSNFDDAVEIINKYRKYMLCIITDVKFNRHGSFDENAGIELLEYVDKEFNNLPSILQSSDESYAKIAEKYHSLFIHKHSQTLYQDLQHFLTNYLGFGDFVFRDKHGNQIAVAQNMKSFEDKIKIIPDESLIYHATRNNFSMWLMARGEIRAASIINPKRVADFKDADELRSALLNFIKAYRNEQDIGTVVPFSYIKEYSEKNIYTLAEGSMGGKGRGLAFINALIYNYDFSESLPDIKIRTPKTFVIGIQEFENFIRNNNLEEIIYDEKDYSRIRKAFLQGELSDELMEKLSHLISIIKKPLAVRSSGIFEDSLTQPFAGIFDTYLLPNNHPDHSERLNQIMEAIKLVFASAFSATAQGYVKAINYKIEDERMAVVIQETVGHQHGQYFYPHISGVAQSFNFYPFAHMEPEEGFGLIAVGLGKYVVEGNRAYRFSPRYPGTEINSPKDQFRNSQVQFYAMDLKNNKPNLLEGEHAGLKKLDIPVAEKHKTLNHSVSTYDPDSNRLYPGISRPGPRIVNFANILQYNYIPLARTLEVLLELGRDAMGTAVEIEYAIDLKKDKEGFASFYILQIKPLISSSMECNANMNEIPQESILLYSKKGMGNGCLENIRDVIYVDSARFDKSKTEMMAAEIEELNQQMAENQIPYILIGPGRWGTRDRWIGIPVKWHQISNARVIVETSLDDFPLDASSGSHFFHNVTTMNVGYFTVQPELTESFIEYDLLSEAKLIRKGKFFNHVRFKDPLVVKMDGRQRIYCIHLRK
ncbi:MAG: PEP/pyruvate-binding domain-containing protein [bacterium]|jgi:hypothetical protein